MGVVTLASRLEKAAAKRRLSWAEVARRSGVPAGYVRSLGTGHILGFIVAMTIVIGSFLLILDGHTDQGAAGIIATLVTIVGVFVYSDVTRRRERSKKAGR